MSAKKIMDDNFWDIPPIDETERIRNWRKYDIPDLYKFLDPTIPEMVGIVEECMGYARQPARRTYYKDMLDELKEGLHSFENLQDFRNFLHETWHTLYTTVDFKRPGMCCAFKKSTLAKEKLVEECRERQIPATGARLDIARALEPGLPRCCPRHAPPRDDAIVMQGEATVQAKILYLQGCYYVQGQDYELAKQNMQTFAYRGSVDGGTFYGYFRYNGTKIDDSMDLDITCDFYLLRMKGKGHNFEFGNFDIIGDLDNDTNLLMRRLYCTDDEQQDHADDA